jgi:hypothetical protein
MVKAMELTLVFHCPLELQEMPTLEWVLSGLAGPRARRNHIAYHHYSVRLYPNGNPQVRLGARNSHFHEWLNL